MTIKFPTFWDPTKIDMLKADLCNSEAFSKFFQPLGNLIPACQYRRSCPEVPDLQ